MYPESSEYKLDAGNTVRSDDFAVLTMKQAE